MQQDAGDYEIRRAGQHWLACVQLRKDDRSRYPIDFEPDFFQLGAVADG